MTKYKRKIEQAFTDDGRINDRFADAQFNGHAHLVIDEAHDELHRIHLNCSWWFTLKALEELIAELIFLKEEWDNHPLVLERQQVEDMEELDELDEEDDDEDFLP